jgi:Kef-type K+ transport system membrane component KefB
MTLQWLVISVCLGSVTAWIFVSLSLTRTSQAELTVYLLGIIALAGGVAFALHLSALFVSFVCGLVVANLTHVGSIRGRVMTIVAHGDRFLYLLLLVLAGAYWKLPNIWVVFAALVYVGVRLLGKVTGGYLSTRRLAQHHAVPPLIGLGLVSQGGMGLAIIVELRYVVDQPLVEVVTSVAITAIIINELLAPWLAIRTAGRAEGSPT